MEGLTNLVLFEKATHSCLGFPIKISYLDTARTWRKGDKPSFQLQRNTSHDLAHKPTMREMKKNCNFDFNSHAPLYARHATLIRLVTASGEPEF